MATAPGQGDWSGEEHLARSGQRLRRSMLARPMLHRPSVGAGLALPAKRANIAGLPVGMGPPTPAIRAAMIASGATVPDASVTVAANSGRV